MCAVLGDHLPVLPSLLLATSPASCSNSSSCNLPVAGGKAAEHQNDFISQPAPPDPHCEGGVGQGCVITASGPWGCDSAPEGQGHVRYGHAAGILPCGGVHAVWRGMCLNYVLC